MLEFLSDLFLRIRIKKKLKTLSNNSKSKITHFQSMLVLVPIEYQINEGLFLDLAKVFKIPTKNIKVVVISIKQLTAIKSFKGQLFNCSKEFIGFWGKLPKKLDSFLDQEFDLLVNYFENDSLLASWLSTNCKAKLRVGFYKTDKELNDLILNIKPTETELFISQSTIYLKALLK